MKANRIAPFTAVWISVGLTLFVASCASPPPPPAPVRPAPLPRPTYRPAPPPPPVVPRSSWRDEPITPGVWRWSRYGNASSARFAEGASGPLLELRCDRASGNVVLLRPGTAPSPVAVTVRTTGTSRSLIAAPIAGPPALLAVTIPARDSLLDAIAFSRGRFAVEAAGTPPVYAPSWPEISRVIEDCR